MNVCLVAPVSAWRGGIHQYAVNVANSLAARARVQVIGYRRLFPLWLYPGASRREDRPLPGEVALRADITVHDCLKYYSVLSALRAAALVQRVIRPDVVDIHWIVPQHGLVLIPLMARLRHTRTVLTIHNVLPHEPRPLDRVLSRTAFRLADRLLVHAESLKDSLVGRFGIPPERIRVLPHGICATGPAAYTPGEARARLGIKESRVVLFFGFVRPYKGLDHLIQAMKLLAGDRDTALLIVGEFFSDPGECQEQLRRAGIADSTYLFARYVPYEEVPLFFSAADLLVQPYVTFAGQSGVTQTAYLHRVPVVATDVGGLPELVLDGKTGCIVKAGDVAALSRAIQELLADPARRRELGENGRRFLETELSWEVIAERLLEIYAEP